MTDLLLAWGSSGQSLPRFAAALSAWPQALCPTADLLGNKLYQCVTAALQDMCSTVGACAARQLAGMPPGDTGKTSCSAQMVVLPSLTA